MVTGPQILQLKVTRSKVILKGPKTTVKCHIYIVSLTYTAKSVSVAYIPSLLTFTAVFLEDCVIRGIVTEFLNAKFGTNLNQF